MKTSDNVEYGALHRLHPISMIFFVAKTSKELYAFLPLIPAIAIVSNQRFALSIGTWWLSVYLVTLAVLILLLLSWYRWRKFGYRIEKKAIYVEHGLWVKKKMWIFHDRIQSLNTTQAIYDRVFGLIRLQVETAGGKEPEMVLSSISAVEADRIRTELGFAAVATDGHDPVLEHRNGADLAGVKTIAPSELLLHSMLPDKYMYALLVFAGIVFNLGGDSLKSSQIWRYFQNRLGSSWIVLLLITFILLSWIIAVVLKFIDDYGFKLESSGDKLRACKSITSRFPYAVVPVKREVVS